MKKFVSSVFLTTAMISNFASGAVKSEFKTINGVYWEIQQPSSSNPAERAQAAQQACEGRVASEVATAERTLKSYINSISFRNVKVVNRYGDWSETRGRLDGSQHHKAGGYADCSYYQEVDFTF